MELQFLIDVWEGTTGIDPQVLHENDIPGMVVRLNGQVNIFLPPFTGHRLDKKFQINWDLAESLIRAVYFVYNPFKTGEQNFDWLDANCPAGAFVCADVELARLLYSPKDYGNNVKLFEQLVTLSGRGVETYSAQWFLANLIDQKTKVSYWPKGLWWWAQYFASLYPSKSIKTTWEWVRAQLVNYTGPTNASYCPGTINLHQITGDRLILPGAGDQPADVSVFIGTKEELAAVLQSKVPTPQPYSPRIGYVKTHPLSTGPNIVPATDTPGKMNHPVIPIHQDAIGFVNAINNYDLNVEALYWADDVGPTKGINGNGYGLYIQAGWGGQFLKLIDKSKGFVKSDSIRLDKLPDPAVVNSKTTPWLVQRVTTVGKDNKFITFPVKNGIKSPWDRLFSPIFSTDGEVWWDTADVLEVATLNTNMNIRTAPSINGAIVPGGSLKSGTRITVLDIAVDQSGNTWAQISNGWVALHYNRKDYSDWRIPS